MNSTKDLQATEKLKQGDAKTALRLYIELIEEEPQNAIAYQNAAVIEGDLANYDKALSLCAKALEIQPDLIIPHVTRAYILDKLGNKAESRAEARRALEKGPESIEALYCVGFFSFLDDNIREARTYWEKAIAISPSFYLAHHDLMAVYQKTGDVKNITREAIALFKIKPNLENLFRLAYVFSRSYKLAFSAILIASTVLSLFVGTKLILVTTFLLVLIDVLGGFFIFVTASQKRWIHLLINLGLGTATGLFGLALYFLFRIFIE